MRHIRERLLAARLYLVCDERPDQFLEEALHGGVDVVQLRMKETSDEQLLAVGRRYRRLCDAHGALLMVNDSPKVAACAEADGVHLGQDDVSVEQARRVVGGERLIGLSTHSREQIEHASGVDYIGVGPVYPTPTKPGRKAVGLELVSYAATKAGVPFFAIGGINAENVSAVAQAGASRIAVVRALTHSSDPQASARALREAIGRRGELVGSA